MDSSIERNYDKVLMNALAPCNLDDLMNMLSWNKSQEEQDAGIELACKVTTLKVFFQPHGPFAGKPVWDNCARVICRKSDQELEDYLQDMLIWTQDLNWPGALRIQQRLTCFTNADKLAAVLCRIIPYMALSRDYVWAQSILEILENSTVRHLISPSLVQQLEKLKCMNV